MIIFDLDGTLVETRDANLEAYKLVGVTPPDDFHQVHWKTWLPQWVAKHEHANLGGAIPERFLKQSVNERAAVVHQRKNEMLEWAMEGRIRELPLMHVAKTMNAVVLSSISLAAFNHLRRHVNFTGLQIMIEQDIDLKCQVIRQFGPTGVYVDDSLQACRLVRERTGWQTLQAQEMAAL